MAATEGDAARVPSISKGNAQGVLALCEHVGYVVGQRLDAFPVRRPAGSHDVIADPLAIDFGLKDTFCRNVKSRLRDWFVDAEFLAKVLRAVKMIAPFRYLLSFGGRQADPPGLPVRVVQEAQFEVRDGGPFGSSPTLIPEHHLPVDLLSRVERLARIIDPSGLIRVDFLRVPQIRAVG